MEALLEDGLVVYMECGAIITGSVPAEGDTVRCLVSKSDGRLQNKVARVDQSRRYRVDGLGEGDVEVLLESEGRVVERKLRVLGVGQELVVDFLGGAEQAELRGRLDLSGDDPSGVVVVVAPLDPTRFTGTQQSATNHNGEFHCAGLLPGKYVLEFRGGSWGASPFHWETVSLPQHIDLVVWLPETAFPSAFIEGTVLRAGRPANDVVVVATVVRASGLDSIECRVDEENGQYRLGPLAPHHEYRLWARHSGGQSTVSIGTYSPLPSERIRAAPLELPLER
jgi:hypothetical protein